MSEAAAPRVASGRVEPPEAERPRTGTDREIRATARQLLVWHGADAVTLRAIARELGITAPALYRYYASREDLLRHVGMDVCADLTEDLGATLRELPADRPVTQLFAVCRGFRGWACAHPREFSLVFATPERPPTEDGSAHSPSTESFGRVFLAVAGRMLTAGGFRVAAGRTVPAEMRADLLAYREVFLANLEREGIAVPAERVSLGTVYFMLEVWTRLYGHVALEVFGRFPYQIRDTEPLFEQMLAELAAEIGPSD